MLQILFSVISSCSSTVVVRRQSYVVGERILITLQQEYGLALLNYDHFQSSLIK